MQRLSSLEEKQLPASWATVGIFDGVHLGHQRLLKRLVEGAHAAGYPAVVITFSPHPAVVLGGQSHFAYLTPPPEKAALLEGFDVDFLITLEFTPALAAQTAEEFMRRLVSTLGLRTLIAGYDTALGRGREGDVSRLTSLGQQLGYQVERIEPVLLEGQVISSSYLRNLIQKGEVRQAAQGLGRWYSLVGSVVPGDGLGRKINVPTANLDIPSDKLLPANGVYACWAWVEGRPYLAVTNIGIRPTFAAPQASVRVETHLLDFHQSLYGYQVKIDLVERLREEKKFASVEMLLEQIQADIARARAILQA